MREIHSTGSCLLSLVEVMSSNMFLQSLFPLCWYYEWIKSVLITFGAEWKVFLRFFHCLFVNKWKLHFQNSKYISFCVQSFNKIFMGFIFYIHMGYNSRYEYEFLSLQKDTKDIQQHKTIVKNFSLIFFFAFQWLWARESRRRRRFIVVINKGIFLTFFCEFYIRTRKCENLFFSFFIYWLL